MKYQIIKVITEVNDFEEACMLAGLSRQPAFDELPGELFWSTEKQIGVFAVPEPGDDDLTNAVKDFVGLFDGRLVLDEDDGDDQEEMIPDDDEFPAVEMPLVCMDCHIKKTVLDAAYTNSRCSCGGNIVSIADVPAGIPIYDSAAEYFAANPEPQRDDADALTDAEVEELAAASAAAANQFLKELAQ